ncbi:MAG: hypothetical protein E2598_10070 [Sphingobium sp.]|nr:hypothetical protein [Sphingobium sp.]
MIETIAEHVMERVHTPLCRGILSTPPLQPKDDGVVLFSMIGTAVVIPYLVAVKSLHRHLGRGRVILLDDGTLTPEDKAVLARHLGNPRIISIHDVDVGPCPKGGTWERLLTLLDLRRDDYVIQLDSDTVTVGPVPDVALAIDDNVSFTLLGADGDITESLPVAEFARRYFTKGVPDTGAYQGHVQGLIEASLTQLSINGCLDPHYIRGCSGFTGFASGGNGRALAESFSQAASALLGNKRWAEWGTEQVTSSFVIANDPGARVLPPEYYTNFWDMPLPADPRMIHFIGSFRHRGLEYVRRSWAEIKALRQA